MEKAYTQEEILQRTPKLIHPLVRAALESYQLLNDIGDLVSYYPLKAERFTTERERDYDLMEHLVALIAAEGIEGNPERKNDLRRVAFGGQPIDCGAWSEHLKTFTCKTVNWISDGRVGCYEIWGEDGQNVHAPAAPDGYVPRPGSKVWTYEWGLVVLGVVVDGHVFYYQTIAQYRTASEADAERRKAATRAKLPQREARIVKLPDVYQQRLRKLQNGTRQQEEREEFELFVCEQAAFLAEKLRTPQEFEAWRKTSLYEQALVIPEMLDIAKMCRDIFGDGWAWLCPARWLAHLQLTNPRAIARYKMT